MRIARRPGELHRSFALGEEIHVRGAGERGVEDTEELEIIMLEHDAVIAGAAPEMRAARARREAQSRPHHARRLEIAHRDQQMIDAGDAAPRHVLFPPFSFLPAARSGKSRASPSRDAAQTPRSVMSPVTRRAGVTSKA